MTILSNTIVYRRLRSELVHSLTLHHIHNGVNSIMEKSAWLTEVMILTVLAALVIDGRAGLCCAS